VPTVGSIPLWLDIAGQPNVPSNANGQLEIQIPVPAPEALECNDAKPPPTNVLAGPPARDLLAGPGSATRHVRAPDDEQRGR
jgi:hypothetical protein